MTNRSEQITDFLKAAGRNDAKLIPLAPDASSRSYFRLAASSGSKAALLMNVPPESGLSLEPYIKMTAYLLEQGFSAPEIYAMDKAAGFLLIEDFGDALYTRVCDADPDIETKLFEDAADLLVALQQRALPSDLPLYDEATYLREARLFIEWYLPALGVNLDPASIQKFEALICKLAAELTNDHSVVILRDYHSENLFHLPERGAFRAIGLIDFQDALIGHPTYDLVSILQDARRDTSNRLQQHIYDRFVKKSGVDPIAFAADYAFLGAQRNIKIIGIFTRLHQRDGKAKYLDMIPRVWDHLQRDLSHPNLAELKGWLDTHVPVPNSNVIQQIAAAS